MALEVFYMLTNPMLIFYLFLGVAAGITIGALPGLTATMGVALVLPLTFGMDAASGILLLIGVYKGAIYGGAIPSILLRTPGTPASAAATIDGYEFSKRGEGGRAIGICTVASFVGGIISCIAIILIAPQLARFALRFSSPEFFMLAVFGLTIISSVSGKHVAKGLLCGFMGILVSTIGIDIVTGVPRYTFGNVNLLGGISFIPAMIGLFAMTEVLSNVETINIKTMEAQRVSKVIPTKEDMKVIYKSGGIGGVIGTLIGIVPGAGAEIAAFVVYNFSKQTSKQPEKYGTGITEAIAAPESANNAQTGGALIPMLTLGIPGDATTAILIGALTMQGLQPGPLLFQDHAALVYTIFGGMVLANVFMLILGLSTVNIFTKLLSIPKTVLTPLIAVLCVVGAYAINMNFFDVYVMMFFGVLGYFLKKLDVPIAPATIGIILGPMAERHFRTALIMSGGEMSVFVSSPIAVTFLTLAILTIALPFIRKRMRKSATN
ncbi:MAG: tripartite tricarboxylate transporter permease [Defluviitaleaceae bacterium]|nr:tripartite tricarboxylate transporter permease [Defluviitaleaceae bacterium]